MPPGGGLGSALPRCANGPSRRLLLVHHFLRDLSPAATPTPSITERALQTLLRYSWPGNIRQLRNEIERALVFVGSEPLPVVDQRDLSSAVAALGPVPVASARTSGQSLDEALSEAERAFIAQALAAHEGQVTASARALGLTRQGLYKKNEAARPRRGFVPVRPASGRPPRRCSTSTNPVPLGHRITDLLASWPPRLRLQRRSKTPRQSCWITRPL